MDSLLYLSQFDIAYRSWGFWGMVLFYPAIFGNFLLGIKIIETGIEKKWDADYIIHPLLIASIFLPLMIGMPLIWIVQRMVVN